MSSVAYGQVDLDYISDSILNEATTMYKLEKASWKSTDYLLYNYSKRYIKRNVDGYLSYEKGDSVISIYWEINDTMLLIKNTFRYRNEYSLQEFTHDHIPRQPNKQESDLISIHDNIVNDIVKNSGFYYKPTGSNYNIILMNKGNDYRAYLLIGFKKKNVVPLGNDYQIELNAKGEITSRVRLHNSYLETPFTGGMKFKDSKISEVYHTHFDKIPFITTTDICNVMLYKEFIEWGGLVIVSKYISEYNTIENTLKIKKYDPK